jgi:ribosomal protein L13E
VQFTMPLQVMKTAEAHLAFGANIGFFLAVCQQMTLKIVMARELGVAVGAFMLL